MLNVNNYEDLSIAQLWFLTSLSANRNKAISDVLCKKMSIAMFALGNSCIPDFGEKVLEPCVKEENPDITEKTKEIYGDRAQEVMDEILQMANIFSELLIAREFINDIFPEFEFDNYIYFFGAASDLGIDELCGDSCSEDSGEEDRELPF